MEVNPERKTRVLLIPYLSHGHAAAFLALAKSLVKRNFYIYLCSTPANLSCISGNIQKGGGIEVVEFHLPSSPDLPPHLHTTNRLPPHLWSSLRHAIELSETSFSHVLSTIRPDLLICDFLPKWPSLLATSLGIPAVLFFTIGASIVAFSSFSETWREDYPFDSGFLEDYDEELQEHVRSISSVICRDAFDVPRSTVLIRTFRELEGKYLDWIGKVRDINVLTVGPLVEDRDDTESEESEIMQWLEMKEESSTILVSFGSQIYLSKEQIREIAMGLEMAEVSFIWVLRFHQEDNTTLEDALPLGFLSRIGDNRGRIVEWAPQSNVLRHPSVVGFVSHCGWASVMESMKIGVPIIAMPMKYDQPFNSKLVANVGVGVEVKRGRNGSYGREELAGAIRAVVVEEAGKAIRKKAEEIRIRLKNEEDREIEDVVKQIHQLSASSGKT